MLQEVTSFHRKEASKKHLLVDNGRNYHTKRQFFCTSARFQSFCSDKPIGRACLSRGQAIIWWLWSRSVKKPSKRLARRRGSVRRVEELDINRWWIDSFPRNMRYGCVMFLGIYRKIISFFGQAPNRRGEHSFYLKLRWTPISWQPRAFATSLALSSTRNFPSTSGGRTVRAQLERMVWCLLC